MKKASRHQEIKTSGEGLRRRAFTLIEVIVVILIIGVLAAAIAPRLLSRVGQSKHAVGESNAAALAQAMKLFIADHGEPDEGSEIMILWERPSEVEEANWEPYVDSGDALLDPWGNAFVLRIPGEKNYDFDIVSYGRDGKPGGDGEDADIVKP